MGSIIGKGSPSFIALDHELTTASQGDMFRHPSRGKRHLLDLADPSLVALTFTKARLPKNILGLRM